MWVYGDRPRREDPRNALERLAAELEALAHAAPGVDRHGRLAGALILAGEIVQALADAEFEACGEDRPTPLQATAGDLAMALASELARSWDNAFGGGVAAPRADLDRLAALDLPARATFKTGEGFAYYAVYPEAYLAAARAAAWSRPPQVVGLRSIGTTLAAMVAVGAGSKRPITARPTGHPFDRRLSLGPELKARLAGPGPFAVADEGPGLSGSSFGAVADALVAAGTPLENIAFFPSHDGAPGPQAPERHRLRWAQARRLFVGFDDLIPSDPARGLPRWFEDVLGPPVAPLEDLSGGAWRAGRDIPAIPSQERRKFRMRTRQGAYLLKFVGLGALGQAKFARAEALHAAGFAPPPAAFRHGFLAEPWLEHAAPLRTGGAEQLELLADYLALRAAWPAGEDAGASLEDLQAMLAANLPQIVGAPCSPPSLPDLRLRRVRTDNRLHRWEWLQTAEGRLVKTDALDHDDAHDLVGCQDIAWDVAGAEVELDLDAEQLAALAAGLERRIGHAVDRRLLDFYRLAYPAFQAALWSQADASPATDALRAGYRRRIAAQLARSDVAV